MLHNRDNTSFVSLQLTSSHKPTIKTVLRKLFCIHCRKTPGWRLSSRHTVKPTSWLSNWALCMWCIRAQWFKPLCTKCANVIEDSPIQTSPNCPAPSLRSSFRDSRGISHSSCHQGFCGALDWHGFISFVHNPSASPGWQRGETGLKLFRWRPPPPPQQSVILINPLKRPYARVWCWTSSFSELKDILAVM